MKKIYYILLFIMVMPVFAQQIGLLSVTEFQGFIDIITPDKMNPKMATDILNVYTDEKAMLRKRRGTVAYNTTAMDENQPVNNVYEYKLSSGKRYMVVNSTWGLYVNTNPPNFTRIFKSSFGVYADSLVTVKDTLYRDNGYDVPGKWDGTDYISLDVFRTTNVYTTKYQAYWRNRLWKAGRVTVPNIVYYSEVLKPDDFNDPVNNLPINQDDGDKITGFIPWGERLLVLKQYAVYEIVERTGGSFVVNRLTDEAGCLYNTTAEILRGYPTWQTHRGIETFSGAEYQRISRPIDNTLEALDTTSVGLGVWSVASAPDWGEGTTSTAVDTDTVNGSLIISSGGVRNQEIGGYYVPSGSVFSNRSYQTFMSSMSGILKHAYVYVSLTPEAGPINLTIRDGDLTDGSTSYSIGILQSGLQWCTGYFNVWITSGVTYQIWGERTIGGGSGTAWARTPTDDYARGQAFFDGSGKSYDYMFAIDVIESTPTYTSAKKDTTDDGGTFDSWDTMTWAGADQNNATFEIRTAPSESDLNVADWYDISKDAVVPSTSNPWAQWRVLIKSTETTLTKVEVSYYTDNTKYPPQAIVYRDRYYIAVSTDDTSDYNKVVYCYQKDNTWTELEGINVGSWGLYNDKPYYGDGADSGLVYEFDVANRFNDNGSAYRAYWIGSVMDEGLPFLEKVYSTMWVHAENSGNWNLGVSYRMDGTTAWTDKICPLGGSRTIFQKIPFVHATKGRSVQIKFENNNADEDFGVKRIDIIRELLKTR